MGNVEKKGGFISTEDEQRKDLGKGVENLKGGW